VYIRENRTYSKKTQSEYTKYQLVESYRSPSGPRQRVITTFLDFDLPKSSWKAVAHSFEQRILGKDSLFEEDPKIKAYVDEAYSRYLVDQEAAKETQERKDDADTKAIDLNTISHSESRSLGPELVANWAYESLAVDKVLTNAGISDKERMIAKAVILARLVSPGSDAKTYRYICESSAISELVGIELAHFNKDQVYKIADSLIDAKTEIEKGLVGSQRRLLGPSDSILLYDLTNTYFEGSARSNTIAKYGHSKEKRSDCPLVSLAMVTDCKGRPIYSEIYEGNVSEPRTLSEVLKSISELHKGTLSSAIKPTIVMDRGIATKENIKIITDARYRYVVITRANSAAKYKEHFLDPSSFLKIEDSSSNEILLKKITVTQAEGPQDSEGPDNDPGENSETISDDNPLAGDNASEENTTEENSASEENNDSRENTSEENNQSTKTVVLCRSAAKEKTAVSINARTKERFLADTTRLVKSVEKGNISRTQRVSERIGRIKARYPSVAKYYDISLVFSEDHGTIESKKRIDKVIEVKVTEKPEKKPDELAGCYVIETDHHELSAEEIYRIYTSLTKVEDSFRSLKTDLGIRPVYHQLEKRTKGHLFISVLAYYLLSAIEATLERNGNHSRFSSIKETLSTHQRATVRVTTEDDVVYSIRSSGTPEPKHKEIYQTLGVKDPLRKIKRPAVHL